MQSTLPKSGDYHLPRRIFHVASGCGLLFVAISIESKVLLIKVLLALFLSELFLELIRLNFQPAQRFLGRYFGFLMRQGEEGRLSGIPYYLLGCLFSFTVFPKEIAILAVSFLAFGDPVASLAGVWCKKKWRSHGVFEVFTEKSLQGSVACALVCFLLCFLVGPRVMPSLAVFSIDHFLFSLLGGGIGAIAELVPLRTDDNLSIPLIAGCLLWLLAGLMGFVPGLMLV